MPRPPHIPQEIWNAAKGVSVRFASDEEIARMAEIIMRRRDGLPDQVDEDRIQWQPWLTYRQTRIIMDALIGHDTVIDDDVSELSRLRSWFCGTVKQGPGGDIKCSH